MYKVNPDGKSTRTLPPGAHPGLKKLKSQSGVYRGLLRPVIKKRKPEHADYSGVLPLTGSKARVFVWVHEDGTLGLRLEKMHEQKGAR